MKKLIFFGIMCLMLIPSIMNAQICNSIFVDETVEGEFAETEASFHLELIPKIECCAPNECYITFDEYTSGQIDIWFDDSFNPIVNITVQLRLLENGAEKSSFQHKFSYIGGGESLSFLSGSIPEECFPEDAVSIPNDPWWEPYFYGWEKLHDNFCWDLGYNDWDDTKTYTVEIDLVSIAANDDGAINSLICDAYENYPLELEQGGNIPSTLTIGDSPLIDYTCGFSQGTYPNNPDIALLLNDPNPEPYTLPDNNGNNLSLFTFQGAPINAPSVILTDLKEPVKIWQSSYNQETAPSINGREWLYDVEQNEKGEFISAGFTGIDYGCVAPLALPSFSKFAVDGRFIWLTKFPSTWASIDDNGDDITYQVNTGRFFSMDKLNNGDYVATGSVRYGDDNRNGMAFMRVNEEGEIVDYDILTDYLLSEIIYGSDNVLSPDVTISNTICQVDYRTRGWGRDIIATDDGGCLIGGYIGPGPSTGCTDGPFYGSYFLVKLDEFGDLEWKKFDLRYFTDNPDDDNSTTVDEPGYVTIYGLTKTPNGFAATGDRYSYTSDRNDLLVMTISSDGQTISIIDYEETEIINDDSVVNPDDFYEFTTNTPCNTNDEPNAIGTSIISNGNSFIISGLLKYHDGGPCSEPIGSSMSTLNYEFSEYMEGQTILMEISPSFEINKVKNIARMSALEFLPRVKQQADSYVISGSIADYDVLTEEAGFVEGDNAHPQALLIKTDAEFQQTWRKVFRGDGNGACIFGFNFTEDDGYVAVGNNGANCDDHIIIKLNGECESNYICTSGINPFVNKGEVWTPPNINYTISNTNELVLGHIRVPNNVTLTIEDAELTFADTRLLYDFDVLATNDPNQFSRCGITVEGGGKLILKNAHLKSLDDCANNTWEGISVLKNNSKIGIVEIQHDDNTIIEDAIVGIRNYPVVYDAKGQSIIPTSNTYTYSLASKSGGEIIIHPDPNEVNPTTTATFRNNVYHIHTFISSASIVKPSKLQASDIVFYNDEYLWDPTGTRKLTEVGVLTRNCMVDINGANFYQNVPNSLLYEEGKMIGVKSEDGEIRLNDAELYDLKFGVHSYGIVGKKLDKVTNSTFTDNDLDAYFKGVKNVYFAGNKSYFNETISTNPYSISLVGCRKFDIFENEFNNRGIALIKSAGIDDGNYVRNNDISGSEVGVLAWLNNDGTEVLCNKFEDSSKADITLLGSQGQIASNQGSPGGGQPDNPAIPAGNRFSITEPAIANVYAYTTKHHNYYHHADAGSGVKFEPSVLIPNTSSNQEFQTIDTGDFFNEENSCPVIDVKTLSPSDKLDLISELGTNVDAMTVFVAENNEDLVTTINTSNDQNLIHQSVLSASPYVSEEALINLIDKSDYSEFLLVYDLYENSPMTATTFSALQNRTPAINPMFMSVFEQIQSSGEVSGIESINDYIASLSRSRSNVVSHLINDYRESGNYSTGIEFLEGESSIGRILDRRELYLANEQYSAAADLLNTIDPEEDTNLTDLLNLEQWIDEHIPITFDEVSAEHLSTIETLSMNDNATKARAENILSYVYGTEYPIEFPTIEASSGKTAPIASLSKPIDNWGMELSPNPAKDYLNISFPILIEGQMQCELRLTDMQGNIIKNEVISQPLNQIVVKDLAKGPYIVSIYHDGLLLDSQKVMIVK